MAMNHNEGTQLKIYRVRQRGAALSLKCIWKSKIENALNNHLSIKKKKAKQSRIKGINKDKTRNGEIENK